MRNYEHLFIGGGWVSPASDESIDVISPATETAIGRVPLGSAADIDNAVGSARSAFDHGSWPRWDPAERAIVVARFAEAIRARADEFADVLSAEVGLPRKSVPTGQLAKTDAAFEAFVDLAASYPWVETRPGSGGRTLRVNRVPVGVAAAIVPWNAPLFIAALKLAPALVAGATVVLKPAVETPLHAYLLAEAAVEAGLPAGVLNVVVAGPGTSEYLVRHSRVDKVSFTGSTAVGRRVGELCGHGLRRCTLELGGKSAAILLEDFELDSRNIAMLSAGAMANSGQVCAAQARILVPRSRYDEVVDALTETVKSLTVGDPFDENTDVGPLVSQRQRDRVEDYLSIAHREGAKATVGGGRPDIERGWFVEPTVFRAVEPHMTVAREEIFGPVAAVLAYDSEQEAIDLANDSDCGLAGAVWTSDHAHGEDIAGRIRTGSVAVNSPAPLDVRGPFGGFKQSGIGREGGPEAINAYTEYQTILLPSS